MFSNEIEVTVNSRRYREKVEPRLLLVDFLRDKLKLTGTHVGCDTGVCGACTVLMDGKAVKSCSLLAVQADGRNIVTVEGLADGEKLNPLQEAFHELHAVQCGYCTPGFLMCLTDLLQRKRTVEWTDEEIRLAISGNICRCTGYENIVKAAKRVLNGRSLSKPSQTNAAQLR